MYSGAPCQEFKDSIANKRTCFARAKKESLLTSYEAEFRKSHIKCTPQLLYQYGIYRAKYYLRIISIYMRASCAPCVV